MVQTRAVTEAIKRLPEAETRFNLQRSEDESFFTEWHDDLPEITDVEKAKLNQIRQRYLYHRNESLLLEGAIKLLIVPHLFELAGFYDPPFTLRSEVSVDLVLDEVEAEVLRGRIDVLVMQDRFWVVVLESKRMDISVWAALPQTLAYMMANSPSSLITFGMITNGDEIMFVKLSQESRQYDISGVFSLLPLRNQLYPVLAILKRISRAIGAN